MKKVLSIFAGIVVLCLLAPIFLMSMITVVNLIEGSRLSVYQIAEHCLCPTQAVEGQIERIELVGAKKEKLPFRRITYTRNVYQVKLDSSPHRFIFDGPSNNDLDPRDDSSLLRVGRRLKIVYHENIVPWEKSRMPMVTDEYYFK